MARPSETTGPDQDVLISVEGVGKDFGHFIAVREVSLVVRRGELKAIIGPNGAGKPRRLICYPGDQAVARSNCLSGQRILLTIRRHALAHVGIGRSFQITNVFRGLTVLENVRIAVQSKRQYIDIVSSASRLSETAEIARTGSGDAD
jgi:branched-chain amino acid transport system ATP-binding protein